MKTVLFVFGTRPEAIKMAPVIQAMAARCANFRSVICVTAQHRQMLDQVLELFHVRPDYDLDIMQHKQTLSGLTAAILLALEPVLLEVQPDWVLVQGDTTTAMAASLLAFYHHIRVGHIEAGLRTANKHAPFPEEINRRITGVLADLHFAPTQVARRALLAEGVPEAAIHVTGNTVIDALLWVSELIERCSPQLPEGLREAISGKRVILVTGHRRESFGGGFEQICLALRDLAQAYADCAVVYPVHLNPHVQEPVQRILGDVPGVHLLEPLSYAPFVWLMKQSHLILTDSGGIQEEAPSLGKPVLVMRDTTERREGIEAGNALLTGVERSQIVRCASEILDNSDRYRRMATAANPYGNGRAAQRIVEVIAQVAIANPAYASAR